jgi:hypothetical protein
MGAIGVRRLYVRRHVGIALAELRQEGELPKGKPDNGLDDSTQARHGNIGVASAE